MGRRASTRGAHLKLSAAVGVLALPVLVLALAAVHARWLPFRVSDVWPLQLAEPGGWLVDAQLADLRGDAELCRRTLTPPGIVAAPVAASGGTDGCGWENAVRVASAGGARLVVGTLSCEVSAALALWIAHVVQPAAVRHFGQRIAEIEHMGSYACRNIRGSPAFAGIPSQHARANALDVRGFVLADGRRFRIVSSWGGDHPEGRFLAEVHKGACAYFRVAIGPAYNLAHRDHFHLDRGPWRACR